uniref:C6 domain-containing protein n=1 Tax=Panagrolaimus superbus TaxID=310955 RepID=A0A914XZ57_9BILA
MFFKILPIILFIFSFVNCVATAEKCPPLNLTTDTGNPIPKLGAETKIGDIIQMPISCTGKDKKDVYMFFNGNIGGPSHPKNEPITAHLHCIDGKWKYTENGVSIVITQVSCISA